MTSRGADVRVAGLVLAAGRGRRMGGPKVLLRDADGRSYLHRTVAALMDGGCAEVVVVLGSAGRAATENLSPELAEAERGGVLRFCHLDNWSSGMGTSLVAGLRALSDWIDAAAIMLVDLPDVDERVVRRVLDAAAADVLARATFNGRPGHPVVVGRSHWNLIEVEELGDRGAQSYLEGRGFVAVPCGDLASGRDVDTPGDLRRRRGGGTHA